MQNRLKSKAVWISIASFVIFVLVQFGILEKVGLSEDTFKYMIDTILSILVVLGILNNPTDKNNF